jgi:site-specific recombinase XerD
MFNQIFKCPRTIERHTAAPFSEQRVSYLNHCAAQGAPIGSLRLVSSDLLAIIDFLGLQPEGEISRCEIEAAADRWITRPNQFCPRKDSSGARTRFITHARHWLSYLNRLQLEPVTPCPEAPLLSEYVDYLTHERDFSPATIGQHRHELTKFLRRVCQPNRSLQELTITDIDQVIVQKTKQGEYSRQTVRTFVCILRSFFRYAESRGWCAAGIAQALIAPCLYRGELLPAGPSWGDVQRLLAEAEGDSRTQIRDRAILLLFAVYGLRVSEVRRLQLEDLDWERELLTINRSKPKPRTQTYPLQQAVGDAILRYLKEVRPNCPYREVFISLKAPLKPLSSAAFWQVVNQRLRPLNLPLKHQGPHALRHACASHLLAEGLSFKEIGDHLGHRCSDATAIYAKVDLVGLCQVADFSLGGLR